MGDLKQMQPRWLVGVGIQGYGCSLAVGLGIPIPILDEEIARMTGVSDEEIFTQIIDYGRGLSQRQFASLAQVSYAELRSGAITVQGQTIPRAAVQHGPGPGNRRNPQGMDLRPIPASASRRLPCPWKLDSR